MAIPQARAAPAGAPRRPSYPRIEEFADEPLVTEVNVSPGLEGIEAATGKDTALEMIRYARDVAMAAKKV